MNETKHTPGPWTATPTAGHETHGQSVVYAEADGKDVAVIYDGKANARLIAAAPELLAACKAIAALMDGQGRANMPEVAGQARAAIAKATVEAMKKT